MTENIESPSPSGSLLVAALAKAKAGIKAPKKGKTAQIPTKAGGKYSYSYADRADVIEAYSAALSANGLALIHRIVTDENKHMTLVSSLWHSSGEIISSYIPLPNVSDAQTLGSWLTYLERYQSCALLDIAAEDDDDGARATHRPQEEEAKPADPSTLPFFDLRVAIRDAAEELAQKGGGLPDTHVREASGFEPQDKKGSRVEFADPFDPKIKSQKWLKSTLSRLTAKLTTDEPGSAEAADLFT